MTSPEPPSMAYAITKQTCAGTDELGVSCDGEPTIPCPHCLLVAYCENACRIAHWPDHKRDCKNKHYSRGLATAIAIGPQRDSQSYLSFWSNYAATDVLNLEKNEGRFFNGTLSIFLSGRALVGSVAPEIPTMTDKRLESSLRHFIYSLLKIPKTATPCLAVSINHHSPAHLCRDFFALHLLFDRRHDPYINAEATIHLWYSARMPHALWRHVVVVMRDYFEDCEMCPMTCREDEDDEASDESEDDTTLKLRWTRGNVKFSGDLIFFHGPNSFPPGATAEPVGEWPMEFLDFPGCLAQNDVYGKLFYYLRDMLVRFQEENKRFAVSLGITAMDMDHLLHRRPQSLLYDRIHMGELWDYSPACNLTFAAGCLQHKDQNPFATMLAISRLSVTGIDKELEDDLCEEGFKTFEPSATILDEHAPPITEEQGFGMETVLRRRIGLLMWRNWEKFSERERRSFINSAKLFAFHLAIDEETANNRSVFKTGFMGMEYKEKNTVTRRWPNRLVHSKGDKPSLRDFNRHVGWLDSMPQRWMEWRRVGDVSSHEWELSRECILDSSWLDMSALMQATIDMEREDSKLKSEQEQKEADGKVASDKRTEQVTRDEAGAGHESEKAEKPAPAAAAKPKKRKKAKKR
ncbi:MYND finger family protein [Metarhizium album ARSEF 1941]|uniref:MYND finger family protein n=1 Tax=Metarhizium album (strain ARSEF 1941) TaxID=1081103 RepID=A0A0B2WV79_METAS|nr:MYND finger family protein [Metarhizium album ARSEF 1941]KHN97544.1 MYND finger family protein [Metarhizium album ARSEF 1941]